MQIKVISSGSQQGNAYLVDDGQTTLLLDAGVSIQKIQIACDFQLSKIAAAMVSHKHLDHFKAVPALIKRGIDCYSGAETWIASLSESHRAHTIKPLEKFAVGTFDILPFDVKHDVETYGFMVSSRATGERLLYITDTPYVKYSFPPVHYIMIEANHDVDRVYDAVDEGKTNSRLAGRIFDSHMSIDTLSNFLKANDLSLVNAIYLMHLSDTHSDAAAFRERIQREVGCEVFLCG